MKMPNFLIIGAAKAGTTSLYSYLKQHPQIYMSKVKEPKFFAFEIREKPNFHEPGNVDFNNRIINDLESYCQLFEESTNEIAIGEASPAYLYVPGTAQRIKKFLPRVKLIVILRNPVERAYSSFLHLRRDNLEPIENFSQALQAEKIRIDNNWGFIWRYYDMGFYFVQLKRYFETFDRSQIKIYLYEEFKENTTGVLQDIFQFLEVEQTFIPDTSLKSNVSGIQKNKTFDTLLRKPNLFKTFLKPLFPAKVRRQVINKLVNFNLAKPKLNLELQDEMTQIFKNDILQLQELIQKDLSAWLK